MRSELAVISAAFAAAFPAATPDEIRAALGDDVARMRLDIIARRDRLRARANAMRAAA